MTGERTASGLAGSSAAREADSRGLLALAVSTAAAVVACAPHVAATNLAMLYLLGVVTVAMRCSRRTSVARRLLSVAAFDFFCVPPYLTLPGLAITSTSSPSRRCWSRRW